MGVTNTPTPHYDQPTTDLTHRYFRIYYNVKLAPRKGITLKQRTNNSFSHCHIGRYFRYTSYYLLILFSNKIFNQECVFWLTRILKRWGCVPIIYFIFT